MDLVYPDPRSIPVLMRQQIAVRRNPPDADEAEAHYQHSRRLAKELEMRPLQAHCHLGLGRLYRRTGRAHEAHVELTNAVQMLRVMEMTLWLPQAEAELLGVIA